MLNKQEIKKLRAEANALRPEIIIGKEGLSEGVITNLTNAFRTKELIKLKLLETCPIDVKELAAELNEKAECETVQIIGRTVILFKESEEQV